MRELDQADTFWKARTEANLPGLGTLRSYLT